MQWEKKREEGMCEDVKRLKVSICEPANGLATGHRPGRGWSVYYLVTSGHHSPVDTLVSDLGLSKHIFRVLMSSLWVFVTAAPACCTVPCGLSCSYFFVGLPAALATSVQSHQVSR